METILNFLNLHFLFQCFKFRVLHREKIMLFNAPEKIRKKIINYICGLHKEKKNNSKLNNEFLKSVLKLN